MSGQVLFTTRDSHDESLTKFVLYFVDQTSIRLDSMAAVWTPWARSCGGGSKCPSSSRPHSAPSAVAKGPVNQAQPLPLQKSHQHGREHSRVPLAPFATPQRREHRSCSNDEQNEASRAERRIRKSSCIYEDVDGGEGRGERTGVGKGGERRNGITRGAAGATELGHTASPGCKSTCLPTGCEETPPDAKHDSWVHACNGFSANTFQSETLRANTRRQPDEERWPRKPDGGVTISSLEKHGPKLYTCKKQPASAVTAKANAISGRLSNLGVAFEVDRLEEQETRHHDPTTGKKAALIGIPCPFLAVQPSPSVAAGRSIGATLSLWKRREVAAIERAVYARPRRARLCRFFHNENASSTSGAMAAAQRAHRAGYVMSKMGNAKERSTWRP